MLLAVAVDYVLVVCVYVLVSRRHLEVGDVGAGHKIQNHNLYYNVLLYIYIYTYISIADNVI